MGIKKTIRGFLQKIWDAILKVFWFLISPPYPYIKNFFLEIGLIHHHGRQAYLFGKLKPNHSADEFELHLNQYGFRRHYIAWQDDGEILNMRKLENFHRQYHIRLFNDGQVRGHYELTPEAHPLLHIQQRGSRNHDGFAAFLKGWIEPVK